MIQPGLNNIGLPAANEPEKKGGGGGESTCTPICCNVPAMGPSGSRLTTRHSTPCSGNRETTLQSMASAPPVFRPVIQCITFIHFPEMFRTIYP